MMMQAAGAGGGVLQSLNEGGGHRRIPPWLWVALGISLTAHIAGLAWLVNQHSKAMPAPPDTEKPYILTVFPPPPPPPTPKQNTQPPKQNTLNIHTPDPLATPQKTVSLTIPANKDSGNLTINNPTFEAGNGDGAGDGNGTVAKAPPVITNPTWLSKPDADAMSRHYPPGAIAAGIEGSATLHCIVTVSGTLSNCTVVSETPSKYGFGNAAKHLAPYFRMKPKTVDGQPVEGAEVTIPIKFSINS